jgi:hypothetical protein
LFDNLFKGVRPLFLGAVDRGNPPGYIHGETHHDSEARFADEKNLDRHSCLIPLFPVLGLAKTGRRLLWLKTAFENESESPNPLL